MKNVDVEVEETDGLVDLDFVLENEGVYSIEGVENVRVINFSPSEGSADPILLYVDPNEKEAEPLYQDCWTDSKFRRLACSVKITFK